MSVLIKGMEMPTSCYACMFFAQTNHWNKEDEADILSHCKRTGGITWESVNGFLPNCPLVPVPPHGRLIDADALRAKQQEDADLFQGSTDYGDKCRRDEAMNAVANIVNAPTIIPAEEAE